MDNFIVKYYKQKKMGSTIFTINWADLGKGALVAAITAALAIIGQSIEAGQLPTSAQLKVAGLAGLTAGIGYIIKNFLTGSDGKFLNK